MKMSFTKLCRRSDQLLSWKVLPIVGRVLRNPNLTTWSEAQKQIILQRKYELERDG